MFFLSGCHPRESGDLEVPEQSFCLACNPNADLAIARSEFFSAESGFALSSKFISRITSFIIWLKQGEYVSNGRAVDFIYLDEQEGKVSGRDFTAVIGARIPVESLDSFRDKFFIWFHDELSSQHDGSTKRVSLGELPTLHGTSFLEGHDDELKLKVLEKFVSTFVEAGGRFRRVGYFNDTITFLSQAETNQSIRNRRVNFCLFNMLLSEGGRKERDFVFISEIDREALKQSLQTLDQQLSTHYYTAKDGREGNISYNYRRFVGHFFAPKHNIGCQLADIAGHLALKSETAKSEYTESVKEIFERYKSAFEYNEIVAMECREKV